MSDWYSGTNNLANRALGLFSGENIVPSNKQQYDSIKNRNVAATNKSKNNTHLQINAAAVSSYHANNTYKPSVSPQRQQQAAADKSVVLFNRNAMSNLLENLSNNERDFLKDVFQRNVALQHQDVARQESDGTTTYEKTSGGKNSLKSGQWFQDLQTVTEMNLPPRRSCGSAFFMTFCVTLRYRKQSKAA